MVTIKDIRRSITNKLNSINIKTYSREVVEGFDIPCAFVSVEKYENTFENSDIIRKYIDIYIRYIDKTETSRLDMLDEINNLFLKTLEVKDRIFTINNKTSLFKDDYVEINFDIEFYEQILDDEHEILDNLELNI